MVELEISRTLAICDSALLASGLRLVVHEGCEDLGELLSAFGKGSTTPKMAWSQNDFTSANAFWLVLYDGEAPIAGVGSRLEEIGRENVCSYWSRVNRRHYGDVNGAVRHEYPTEVLGGIGGRMVYIGELMVLQRKRGNRAVLRQLLMAMHCLARLKFNADWHYAYLRDRDARAGMERCYHFTKLLPGFQRWENPPEGRDCSEWLATISRDEVEFLAKLYSAFPDRL